AATFASTPACRASCPRPSMPALDRVGVGAVAGFFRVFIKRSNRRKPISRATINEALRNIDPADLGLRGAGSEKGGLVKLSTQRLIRTFGSLLDPADAMEQIVNARKDWATAGKI